MHVPHLALSGLRQGGRVRRILLIKHSLMTSGKEGWLAKFLKLVNICLATVGGGPPVHTEGQNSLLNPSRLYGNSSRVFINSVFMLAFGAVRRQCSSKTLIRHVLNLSSLHCSRDTGFLPSILQRVLSSLQERSVHFPVILSCCCSAYGAARVWSQPFCDQPYTGVKIH